jgi:hypothetical protein
VRHEVSQRLMQATGVVIILVRDGKVLVTLRDGNALVNHPHQWELIGGGTTPGNDPRESAYEILQRKFGWRRGYVKLHRLGISTKNVAYLYGDLGAVRVPDLAPGEGALVGEVGPNQLIALVERFGVGSNPGQFIPLFATRLDMIVGLMEETVVPNYLLVRPE